jgi:pumilio homology domain family member 6
MATSTSPKMNRGNGAGKKRSSPHTNDNKKQQYNNSTGNKNTKSGSSYSNNSNKKAKTHSSTTGSNKKQQTHQASSSSSATAATTLRPRKNADVVEHGKRLWNSLRCKNNTTEQTRIYMDELLPLIRNKVVELTMQHDASRIVQAAIQFSNIHERQEIVQELCCTSTGTGSNSGSHGSTTTTTTTTTMIVQNKDSTTKKSNKHTFLDICQSQYAHFVVLKVLKYCNKDPKCVQLLIQALKGNIMKLITHTTGSRIIEALFNTTTVLPKDIVVLKQEIYGPHYALFAQDTLRQLLVLQQERQQTKQNESTTTITKTNKNAEKVSYVIPTLALNIELLPEKKDITMDHVRNYIILKGIDKQLFGYYYFQEIFYEYIHVLMMDENYNEIRNITGTTNITDHCIHLLSSKYGTKLVCIFIAYSTVKDRKRIIKSLKGYAKSALLHKDAYLAIIRLIQCIDDTVALYKNILHELVVVNNHSINTTPLSSSLLKSMASISKSKEIDPSTKKESAENDITSPLLEIALSDTASKFLLLILISTTDDISSYNKVLNPYENEVLYPPNPYILEKQSSTNDSNNIDNNNDTSSLQKVYTSKKEPEIRRMEILQYFHIPLLQQLCSTSTTIHELLLSISGSNVLYQLYVATIRAVMNRTGTIGNHNNDRTKQKQFNDQLIPLLKHMIHLICQTCRENLTLSNEQHESNNDNKGKHFNIFEHVIGHRVIKNIILFDASLLSIDKNNKNATNNENTDTDINDDDDDGDDTTITSFSEMFLQEFVSDLSCMIQYNRGAFIVVALLQVPTLRNRVLQHLPTETILLQDGDQKPSSSPITATAGYNALRQEILKET